MASPESDMTVEALMRRRGVEPREVHARRRGHAGHSVLLAVASCCAARRRGTAAGSLPASAFYRRPLLTQESARPLEDFRQGLERAVCEKAEDRHRVLTGGGTVARLRDSGELVLRKANVIVAGGPPAIQAASKRETIAISSRRSPILWRGIRRQSRAARRKHHRDIKYAWPSWSGSSWSCSRRSVPRSRGWHSSGIRPIPTTHRCVRHAQDAARTLRRTRFNSWRTGAQRDRQRLGQSPGAGRRRYRSRGHGAPRPPNTR